MIDVLLIAFILMTMYFVGKKLSVKWRLGVGMALIVTGALFSDTDGALFILAVPLIILIDNAFSEWKHRHEREME